MHDKDKHTYPVSVASSISSSSSPNVSSGGNGGGAAKAALLAGLPPATSSAADEIWTSPDGVPKGATVALCMRPLEAQVREGSGKVIVGKSGEIRLTLKAL